MASAFLPAVFISASSLHLECDLLLSAFHPPVLTLFPTHGEVMHPGDNRFTLTICTFRLTPVLDPSLNTFPGRFSYWVLPYTRVSLGGTWPRPPPITWLPEIGLCLLFLLFLLLVGEQDPV